MIKVHIKNKSFNSVPVLRDVDLEISAGECVALLGPSGIGKTTLMRIAAGLDKNFLGTVETPERCAMVFQEPNLLPWRSVLQNLALFHPNLSNADLENILDRIGLSGKNDLFPGQLSLGQQRRLALARAFVGRPEALFLDEPFVSLDKERAEDMLFLMQQLIAETQPAVLFITHEADEAKRLSNRIFRLAGEPASLVNV